MKFLKSKQFIFSSFIVLVLAGIAFALSYFKVSHNILRHLSSFSWWQFTIITFVAMGIYLVDAIRYKVFARAFKVELSIKDCFEASIANFFFAWITPGSSLGAPATIYLLKKKGISTTNATLVAFGKSLTGLGLFLPFAFLVFLAKKESFQSHLLLDVMAYNVAVYSIVPVLSIVFSLQGGRLEKWLKAMHQKKQDGIFHKLVTFLLDIIEKTKPVLERGLFWTLIFIMCHILYFSFFPLVGALILNFMNADFIESFYSSLFYTAASITVPTPGGAGISEGTGAFFFSHLVSVEKAVFMTLFFRFLTFYLQIIVGLIYFAKIGIGKIYQEVLLSKE